MKMSGLSTAWAVFLGANTPERLAAERRISRLSAVQALGRAHRSHLITRDCRGIYRVREGFPR